MNVKRMVENIWERLQTAAGQLAAAAVFIVLVGISQLFYTYIPNALYLNYLFVFSGILLTAECMQYMQTKRKGIVVMLQLLFIAGVYTMLLLTLSTFTETVCFSLIYLYCTAAVIAFFSAQDFTAEFKQRLVHVIIAFLFFAAVYAVVYSIVFLLDAIFVLGIRFTDSIIFRITNAAAAVTGLAVLGCYRSKPLVHSKFFILMFKTLLPVLLLPFGILCLVYLLKYIIAPSAGHYGGLYLYYSIAGLFLIAVLMIQHFEIRKKTVLMLLGFLAAGSFLFIAVLVRAHQVNPGNRQSIGFSPEGTMPFHEIAVNAVLSLYFLYALWKDKKITGTICIPAACITLILFFPVFGFYHTVYFKPEEPIKQQSSLTAFIMEKSKPQPREHEYWYYRYNGYRYESETISHVIDTKGYSHILLHIRLTLNQLPAVFIPSTAKAVYDSFSFSLDREGKCLIIADTKRDTVEKLDFYTRIKTDSIEDKQETGSKSDKTEKSFMFENDAVKITILDARYDEARSAAIHFHVYIKGDCSIKTADSKSSYEGVIMTDDEKSEEFFDNFHKMSVKKMSKK